ncbi:DUF2235 domain-containing protein [Amaricoccus tamworthensis]|uniref:DUF2235 domain-containing protein n=1 Tax=Amaricoccus tamworthensis TaxID=57002 RepID=UPI003C7E8F85
MKRIVIACDGTWSRSDATHPTNVLELARAVVPQGEDGCDQVVCHVNGVGTRGNGRVTRTLDVVLGGVFGIGLMETLLEAYRFLIFNYAPGDAIFLFGFSRGAFTARSLAGMIRNCGILQPDHLHMLPEAVALYQSTDARAHPKSAQSVEFRQLYSSNGAEPPSIAFLGVWDTVGALGIPESFGWASTVNAGLKFHDTSLSKYVKKARHAVAIDERRRTFLPTLWDNLDRLGGGGAGYHQCWFPGDHGSVGGGGPNRFLSNDALLWVAAGAAEAGLSFDPKVVSAWSSDRDFAAPFQRPDGLFSRLLHLQQIDRSGPRSIASLAGSAIKRWKKNPLYRPRTLNALSGELERI